VDIAVDLGDDAQLGAGDSASLDFNACVEDGVRLDGGLSMDIRSANDDGSQFSADATVDALTARIGAFGHRADGTIRIALDETGTTQSTLDITSARFTGERLLGNTVRATRTLTDYRYRLVTTLADGTTRETFSYDAAGSFPRLGEVAFSAGTTAAVVTPGGALRPTSGAVLVTGANGTTLDVEVTATGLAWELDRLGDGTVEATGTLTWARFDDAL
jgi:hypothetical protein